MRPTNMLFIMSDQHSPKALGCYGNEEVHTPNLDRLAAGGTQMENAYCSVPVCVPSRASVATGRYAHDLESWDNGSPYTGSEAESWGHRLAAAGHSVTTIGKLHYRSQDDPSGFADQRIPMHVLGGKGDALGCLRGDMPITPSTRRFVETAGRGESEYTRYDRSIAQTASAWLRNEAGHHEHPWALFVSFTTPHFPLMAPHEYHDKYDPDALSLPVQWEPSAWPSHPALSVYRHLAGFDSEPLDERTTRNAIAAYYALVTFLDAQIGIVLEALADSGFADDTRVMYTSDHGEMMGERGIWGKSTMYEASAAVPMMLSGPDVPVGHKVHTNVSLLDCYPSIIEAATGDPPDEADGRPGESLWTLVKSEDVQRTIFSEYHAAYSANGVFMIRRGDIKYVHYVNEAPQLFDLAHDPDERIDLAGDPRYSGVVQECEAELRSIVNPEATDQMAKRNQAKRVARAGGRDALIQQAAYIPYTPAPTQFTVG